MVSTGRRMNPLHSSMVETTDGVFAFFHTMRGPEFLFLYFAWFVLTFAAVLILRHRGLDKPLTTFSGLLVYEGFAVIRLIDGSAHGLHRWENLIIMMVIGGLVFFVRASHSGDGNSSGGFFHSCSSGSGCGSGSSCGGGCGGGGCGGCGGGGD